MVSRDLYNTIFTYSHKMISDILKMWQLLAGIYVTCLRSRCQNRQQNNCCCLLTSGPKWTALFFQWWEQKPIRLFKMSHPQIFISGLRLGCCWDSLNCKKWVLKGHISIFQCKLVLFSRDVKTCPQWCLFKRSLAFAVSKWSFVLCFYCS